ncbi:MAG: oligoendopeptidase F [Eubacteriales bacterium]|nr:oligoendopeptidase F [Clostridiales bacterium]MDY5836049.1 oligoendopeptidase F [Eubacteriales bacterium]
MNTLIFGKFFAPDSSNARQVLQRKDVAVESTWDLSPLYADDAAWEAAFKQAEKFPAEIATFKDNLTSAADKLLAFLELEDRHEREISKLYVYASMKNDEDTAVSKYTGMQSQMGQFLAQYMAAASFAEPALAHLEDKTLEAFYQAEPKLRHYKRKIDQVLASKPHILSPSEEALLAGASQVLEAGSTVFEVLDNADQKFPVIQDDQGQEIELTHARFGQLLQNRDRRVRKDAFQQYYTVYQQYRNTYAQTLSTQVKRDNFLAQSHHFRSAREAALFYNEIPEQVYDQLLHTVDANLSLLHRYVGLRKKLLGLDEIHTYDLYVPVVDEVDLTYTMEEAQQIILKALAPLGEAYLDILKQAFSSRWIDYAENAGKRSGAYSGGCYDSPPYILMTWKGTLDNLYTLAHELGHSCHSYLTRENQSPTYGDYPIFLAEIASTCNENLLTSYLLDTIEDPATRRYIIMNYLDGFKGTVFRQTQFADFEQKIHQADQAGISLTADWMTQTYGELNQHYYGPELAKDPEIALEWARIPHFYYDFYVYQYATGFSAATAFAKLITEGGQAERDAYLKFLSSGSSAKPIDTLKAAGVDMSSAKPIEDAMARFDHFLSLLESNVG